MVDPIVPALVTGVEFREDCGLSAHLVTCFGCEVLCYSDRSDPADYANCNPTESCTEEILGLMYDNMMLSRIRQPTNIHT